MNESEKEVYDLDAPPEEDPALRPKMKSNIEKATASKLDAQHPAKGEQAGFSEDRLKDSGTNDAAFDSDNDHYATASKPPVGDLAFLAGLPPDIRAFLQDYLYTTRKLLLTPIVFYGEMDKEGGIIHPLKYAALSCAVHAVLKGIFTFHFLQIPGFFLAEMAMIFVVSGAAYGLTKGMGGNGTFEATFKIFAYASCLKIISAIPFLMLVDLYGVVLSFFGLREVHKLPAAKTAVIVAFCGILMIVVSLARFFGGF